MAKIIKTSYSGSRLDEVKPSSAFGGIPNDIVVRSDISYQTHMGFGGAFTDSTVECYESLGESERKKVVSAYFSEEGLNYLSLIHI